MTNSLQYLWLDLGWLYFRLCIGCTAQATLFSFLREKCNICEQKHMIPLKDLTLVHQSKQAPWLNLTSKRGECILYLQKTMGRRGYSNFYENYRYKKICLQISKKLQVQYIFMYYKLKVNTNGKIYYTLYTLTRTVYQC